jgi:hypothetical protein
LRPSSKFFARALSSLSSSRRLMPVLYVRGDTRVRPRSWSSE